MISWEYTYKSWERQRLLKNTIGIKILENKSFKQLFKRRTVVIWNGKITLHIFLSKSYKHYVSYFILGLVYQKITRTTVYEICSVISLTLKTCSVVIIIQFHYVDIHVFVCVCVCVSACINSWYLIRMLVCSDDIIHQLLHSVETKDPNNKITEIRYQSLTNCNNKNIR